MSKVDVVLIGSGPSGAMAATTLVRSGVSVHMLDVGRRETTYDSLFPDMSFLDLRERDPNQSRYLLGDRLEGVPVGDQIVGALLTPPRQYLLESPSVARYAIQSGAQVEVRQSLAFGGMGVGWGAACFTYSDAELSRMGLDPSGFSRFYSEVAEEIGVSGSVEDDCYRYSFGQSKILQPPVEIDLNAASTLAAYGKKRKKLNEQGFYLGRTYLALLTRALKERRPNPYYDMDMYHDLGKSVYRPRYTIEALSGDSRFTYAGGMKVIRFDEIQDGDVEVTCENLNGGAVEKVRARRLIVCGGSVNSARLALKSLGLFDRETRFLNSPATFIPCSNLHMLGRAVGRNRISLAQISGIFVPPDAPEDLVSLQVNHYSSLMLFKLAKEMPLPPWAGLLVARLLVNSLSVVGIYHHDDPHPDSVLSLTASGNENDPSIKIRYRPDAAKQLLRDTREKQLLQRIRRLGYLPMGQVRPKWGTSMHYAGTIPMSEDASVGPISVDKSYRLRGMRSVYIGDSSTWNHLPAKGLTFTIMANAKKVAETVIRELGN